MANIHDVAKLAGVSTASVSRFLAGHVVRSADAIAQAIQETGYTPSVVARSLKSGRHSSIGVVVPDVTNPFYAALVKGIEEVTRRSGYQVLLGNSDEDPAQEKVILSELIQRTDGIIISPLAETDDLGVLTNAGVPAVFVDRELRKLSPFDSVLADNRSGAQQAATHLLELGHRSIGVISGPIASTPGRERHEGFIEALQQRHLQMSDDHIRISDFREDGGRRSMLQLWDAPVRPSAVFVANNLMTIGALRALKELGARVPEDISIVGFDDFSLAELLDPPLTVVRRPEIEQGVVAAGLLLKRIGAGASPTPQRVRLPVELIVRHSTAEYPSNHEENSNER